MPTAGEIMTTEPEWVEADASAADVAKKLANTDLGGAPDLRWSRAPAGHGHRPRSRGEGDGARSRPEGVKVGELADQGEVVTIGADDPAEEAVSTMKKYGVRRLPVIDGNRLVGMVSQADVARSLPESRVSDLLGAISEAPPNN